MILIMAKSIIFLIAFITLGYLQRAVFRKNIMSHTNNPYKGVQEYEYYQIGTMVSDKIGNIKCTDV